VRLIIELASLLKTRFLVLELFFWLNPTPYAGESRWHTYSVSARIGLRSPETRNLDHLAESLQSECLGLQNRSGCFINRSMDSQTRELSDITRLNE